MHTSITQARMTAEMINITPLNPLISSCEIKVLYAGKNRNSSFISKGVATKMANSLPNIPIVGEYLDYEQDFGDHAQEMVIDSKGVKMVKRTVPYGVVPADTKVVWQMFLDDDGVEREYLVCQGYLWTGRYPQCARVVEKGNGQSMELDLESIEGDWATLENSKEEYFIINDAIFSALCILGEDVEPCFEGANVTAPKVLYSLDKSKFTAEMSQFMLCLKETLNQNEGGTQQMADINKIVEGADATKDFSVEGQNAESAVVDNANSNEGTFTSDEGEKEDFAKKKEDPKAKDDSKSTEGEDSKTNNGEDTKSSDPNAKEDPNAADDKKKKKGNYDLAEVTEYTELLSNYNQLKTDYDKVVAEYEAVKPELFSLREIRTEYNRAEKKKMVAKFCMLDETDLKDVNDNIDTYSLDQIEAKLSVIAVRKKVNFNLDETGNSDNKKEDPIVSFNAETTDSTPAWLKAVDEVKKNKNI